MTIIIPYSGNQPGLSQLLVSLQPQLHPSDDIYLVDMSKDHSGLKMAKLYGSSRCFIFVEIADVDEKTAISYGMQNMKENKQDGALILYDNCVISTTLISNLKKAIKLYNNSAFCFSLLEVEEMNPNFKWFNSPQVMVSPVIDFNSLYTQCLYVPANNIGINTCILENETVVVLSDDIDAK